MIKWREHPEMIEFMMNFIPGHTEPEIKAAFLERFGILLNDNNIGNFKHKYGVKSGTHGGCYKPGQIPYNKGKKMKPETYKRCKGTMFKPGQTPVNHREVGEERITVDGYIEVKVAEPNKWKLKHRCVWEKETGEKLTTNDIIIMLDGNKINVDFSNLRKLTRAELVRYNQMSIKSEDVQVMDAKLKIAKIKARLGKARRGEGVNSKRCKELPAKD